MLRFVPPAAWHREKDQWQRTVKRKRIAGAREHGASGLMEFHGKGENSDILDIYDE